MLCLGGVTNPVAVKAILAVESPAEGTAVFTVADLKIDGGVTGSENETIRFRSHYVKVLARGATETRPFTLTSVSLAAALAGDKIVILLLLDVDCDGVHRGRRGRRRG